MRLVLHPKVYSDIAQVMKYYERRNAVIGAKTELPEARQSTASGRTYVRVIFQQKTIDLLYPVV